MNPVTSHLHYIYRYPYQKCVDRVFEYSLDERGLLVNSHRI